MTMNIAHEFKPYPGEEKKSSNQQPKSAIVCLGSTGTGKSALLQLYCGNKVIVGHGTDSQTSASKLFQELHSNNRYWLDSQGANDSSGVEDEKVLTDIMKKLHNENITEIKIIWCVDSGDICRKKEELQTQAAFIKSLGKKAWESCLIIKKRGRPQPCGINGVLRAANDQQANINGDDRRRLFGYTGLNYKKDPNGIYFKDSTLELINETSDSVKRQEKLKKYGYFTNKEIVAEVSGKLSCLRSLCLEFTIQKCSKCSAKGDPRFVYAPCHTQLEKHHPQSTYSFHSGSANSSYEWYHPGSLDQHVARNVSLHFLTLGIHTIARAATDSMESWTCCDGNSSASGCKRRETSNTYSCCGWSYGSRGCQESYNCCGKSSGSTGCESRCQCCHKNWGTTKGCVQTSKRKK